MPPMARLRRRHRRSCPTRCSPRLLLTVGPSDILTQASAPRASARRCSTTHGRSVVRHGRTVRREGRLHHRRGARPGPMRTRFGSPRRAPTSSRSTCADRSTASPTRCRAREDLDETVNLVEKTGRRIVAEQADVRDFERLKEVVANGVAELGRLDFVLANAGIFPAAGQQRLDIAAFVDAIDVNLKGVYFTIEAALARNCCATATAGPSSSRVRPRDSSRSAPPSTPSATAPPGTPPPNTA